MAKAKKKFKLSRTINGITYVNSKAYQPHVRAKRGTYTPIVLADGLKRSGQEQTQANQMAKIVFDAVNAFAPNFKDGQFWSRLVSKFRVLIKSGNGFELFEGMEVRPDYPMSKQGAFSLKSKQGIAELSYKLNFDMGYRLSLLRIATDHTMLIPYLDEIIITEIGEGELEGKVQLNFAPLADGARMLYVIKCEQLFKGKLEGMLSQKSVSFLKVSFC